MQKNKINVGMLLLLQAAVVIFALGGVFGKIASSYDFLSIKFIIWIGLELFCLGLYAIFWQQLIKKIDISIAYANKATSIFWSMVFAFFLFKETITIKNIVGVVIIFIGIMVVNKND